MSSTAFTPALLTTPTYPGQNELNLVTNPAAATSVTTGWTASGLSASRDTTANPLNPVVPTGFSLSSTASSQTFTSDALTVPATLQNRKLKVEFYYQYVSGTAFTVKVLDGTNTAYSLSTDVSGTTTLANQTGKFVAYFDTNNTTTLKVQLASTGTGVTKITNIIVGPGIQPQGFAGQEWQSYTPVLTASTSNPTTTAASGRFRRVGSNVEVQTAFTVTAYGTGVYIISLPSGLSIDYNSTASIGNDFGIGAGNGYVVTNAGATRLEVVPGFNNTSPYIDKFIPYRYNGAALANTDFTGASSTIFVTATVPVAAWIGSGTVQLAQNDVEFAYNTTTTSTTETTGFGYGPAGVVFQAFAPTGTTSVDKRVRFQTPIQSSDVITVELMDPTTNFWTPAVNRFHGIFAANDAGTTFYGIDLNDVSGSNTDLDVRFFSKTGNKVNSWTDLIAPGWRWRVRKSSAGAAVGFGIVNSQSAGLFPITNSNLDDATATRLGLKQYLHGTTYNGGVAPTVTSILSGFIVEKAIFIPYQLNDGSWRVKASIRATFTSTTLTNIDLTINGVSFNTTTQGGSGFWGGITTPARCYVNTSTLIKLDSASVTTNAVVATGDFELTAKPTWAY